MNKFIDAIVERHLIARKLKAYCSGNKLFIHEEINNRLEIKDDYLIDLRNALPEELQGASCQTLADKINELFKQENQKVRDDVILEILDKASRHIMTDEPPYPRGLSNRIQRKMHMSEDDDNKIGEQVYTELLRSPFLRVSDDEVVRRFDRGTKRNRWLTDYITANEYQKVIQRLIGRVRLAHSAGQTPSLYGGKGRIRRTEKKRDSTLTCLARGAAGRAVRRRARRSSRGR